MTTERDRLTYTSTLGSAVFNFLDTYPREVFHFIFLFSLTNINRDNLYFSALAQFIGNKNLFKLHSIFQVKLFLVKILHDRYKISTQQLYKHFRSELCVKNLNFIRKNIPNNIKICFREKKEEQQQKT